LQPAQGSVVASQALVFSLIDDPFLSILYPKETIAALSLPYAPSAQFLEGVNEIGEVLCCPSNEGKGKGKLLFGFVNPFVLQRWGDDKGVRDIGVFFHAGGPFRGRGLEDIGIGTAAPQQAIDAIFVFDDANYLAKGMTEGTAKG